MDDTSNTGAAPVETYEAALSRITKANAADGGRMLSHTQLTELSSIAQRQWGGGDGGAGQGGADPAPQARHEPIGAPGADPGADNANRIADREAFLTPYGLREHAGRSTADEAVAVASMFQSEGVDPAQAGALLKLFDSGRPATDAQMIAAFGTLSEEDDDAVVDYLNGLDDAHPKLKVMETLQRAGLLGNVGFLEQVAQHARAKRR